MNHFVFKSNESLLLRPRGVCLWSVIVDYPFNPVDVVPHFGVNPREVWARTADAPGHDALEVAVTDEGTSRVTLQVAETNQRSVTSLIAVTAIKFKVTPSMKHAEKEKYAVRL